MRRDGERLPPRPERSESDFDAWLGEATERADPFMAWLGVMFALLVGFEIAAEPGPETTRWLEYASWGIWAVFLTEFVAQLWLAPVRLRFLRRRWWQILLLLIPALRVLRFLRLVRLGRAMPASRVVSSSYRAVGTARLLLRSRLAYLGGLASVLAIAFAELVYIFERDHPESVFESFGDALLWAFGAVIGMQADPVPASVGGRIVMLMAFATGLVVVASLAGVVGAFLVEGRREKAETDRA